MLGLPHVMGGTALAKYKHFILGVHVLESRIKYMYMQSYTCMARENINSDEGWEESWKLIGQMCGEGIMGG